MTYGVGPSGHGRTGAIPLGFWTHRDRIYSVTVIDSNKGSTLFEALHSEKWKNKRKSWQRTSYCVS